MATEDETTEATFRHPLGAVSYALTLSMGSAVTATVVVGRAVVCIARDGRLFADDEGAVELTPADAVQVAERFAV